MQENKYYLPLEIQLTLVCLPDLRELCEMIASVLPELKKWDPKYESFTEYKEHVKEHFNFSANELIKHLEANPETCKVLIGDSYDKRYTPSTFIELRQNKYRVGWVSGGDNSINQIRAFSNFAEATADYVLFSWGFQRLTKEQAIWVEVEHY